MVRTQTRVGGLGNNPMRVPIPPSGRPGPKDRICPVCEAKPRHPCRRWIAGVCREVPDGSGGYWRYLKKPHPGR